MSSTPVSSAPEATEPDSVSTAMEGTRAAAADKRGEWCPSNIESSLSVELVRNGEGSIESREIFLGVGVK